MIAAQLFFQLYTKAKPHCSQPLLLNFRFDGGVVSVDAHLGVGDDDAAETK